MQKFLVDLGMSDITDCMENISGEKNDQTEEISDDDHDYNSSPEKRKRKSSHSSRNILKVNKLMTK